MDTAWSVLSSKIPLTDYHLISQIRVKDLLMDQNRWSPQYLGDFVVLVCPLKTQSSQAMDKRDRNRDNCAIKHYLLCFSCTLASRLSLLFSGAVFHVVTYPPFCLNCVPLLLLILLTGVDATDIALYIMNGKFHSTLYSFLVLHNVTSRVDTVQSHPLAQALVLEKIPCKACPSCFSRLWKRDHHVK